MYCGFVAAALGIRERRQRPDRRPRLCEDYRAGLCVDRAQEEADRAAGRKIRCPMLLLVSTGDDLDIHGDLEAIWRPWAAGELLSRPFTPGIIRPNRRRTSCRDAPALPRAIQGRSRAESAIWSLTVVIPGLEDLHLFVVGAVHEPVFVVDAAGPVA